MSITELPGHTKSRRTLVSIVVLKPLGKGKPATWNYRIGKQQPSNLCCPWEALVPVQGEQISADKTDAVVTYLPEWFRFETKNNFNIVVFDEEVWNNHVNSRKHTEQVVESDACDYSDN